MTLTELLQLCVTRDASDLHLVPGAAPYLRVYGELAPLPEAAPLSASEVAALAEELVGDHGRSALAKSGVADGALSRVGARFRFNVARRQGELSVALRRLEDSFQSLEQLGLPERLSELCALESGLVVVAGPTGSGKSTTLATLLDRINGERGGHLITIEDPIEYVHTPRRCLINQRQVGLDVPDFHTALVAALRQDPDVILVGEVRELDTIRTAIVAAETGHLVFTTVHASDCVSAIERLVAVFPADEQVGIRGQLALTLRAVVAQRLLAADGARAPGGRHRVVVSEVLRVGSGVANLVAQGKPAQIYSLMETGAAAGNQTFDQDLARLLGEGLISERAAKVLARSPQGLADQVKHGAKRRLVGRRGHP